jgi:hypothetical protein
MFFVGRDMDNVFEFNRHSILNFQQASQLLSLVYKITVDADQELDLLTGKLNLFKQEMKTQESTNLEDQIQKLINKWESKIIKLGLEPKGIWLVDFDVGDGYYCWKYPELELKFWHGYKDGFSGRRPIDENNKEKAEISKDISNHELHT